MGKQPLRRRPGWLHAACMPSAVVTGLSVTVLESQQPDSASASSPSGPPATAVSAVRGDQCTINANKTVMNAECPEEAAQPDRLILYGAGSRHIAATPNLEERH